MTKSNKAELDTESLLLTLDQLGQTIDIMNSVVARLRGQVHNHLTDFAAKAHSESTPAATAGNTNTAAVTASKDAEASTRVLH